MFKSINEKLDSMCRGIMLVTGVFLVVTVFIAVLLRYLFETDLYAIDEFEICGAYWFYFISAGYASSIGRQITADIVAFLVKNKKVLLLINMAVNIVTTTVLLLFAYWSKDLILFAIEAQQTSQVWHIPMVIHYTPIVIGLWLMVLYAARDFFANMAIYTALDKEAGDSV